MAVRFSSKSWRVLLAITDWDLSSEAFVGTTFYVLPPYFCFSICSCYLRLIFLWRLAFRLSVWEMICCMDDPAPGF